MYNFYQSDLWKNIQKIVYKNPTFDIEIFGKQYQGNIKEKKIGPIKFRRYQVLGVDLPDDDKLVDKEIDHIKNKFGDKFGNVWFQIGAINEIVRIENANHIYEGFKHDIREIRLGLEKGLYLAHGLMTSFRENMPLVGMVYDVTQSDEELLSAMNESCRKRIRKSKEAGLRFGEIGADQYQVFYNKWLATAGSKGFNIVSKIQYKNLLDFLEKNKSGKLVAVFKNDEIVAGSVCLFSASDYMVCMYGFTDRNFGKLGLNHFLKFETFRWARENGFVYVDTMGGSPTGFPAHELVSVSEFKESLGGEKIELCGNYDIVLNSRLYFIFKLFYRLRK